MGRRTKRGKESRASFRSVLMMRVHVLNLYWTLVVWVYATMVMRTDATRAALRCWVVAVFFISPLRLLTNAVRIE